MTPPSLSSPPPDFTLTCRTSAGGVVVSVTGDLDYASYTRLEATLIEVTGTADGADVADAGDRRGPTPDLVIDLSGVTYCDSCGLRVLLGALQRQQRAGARFRLRGVTGQPERALRLTGLDTVLGGSDPGTSNAPSSAAEGPTVQA